ncbi:hypothetical protein TREES_T100008925 [Tupaia chinensis]|uniref:Uncharacterized protein n=1 Tax=Tupaia chinensis TaxID=246437 RepID=L9L014_TUPCH|nr:hypothetical protein TREES_T100008925 [Tupaia chinensis]
MDVAKPNSEWIEVITREVRSLPWGEGRNVDGKLERFPFDAVLSRSFAALSASSWSSAAFLWQREPTARARYAEVVKEMMGPNAQTFSEEKAPRGVRSLGRNIAVFYILTDALVTHMSVLLGPRKEFHLALEL